ncbi:MAG: tRNA lysidine(34) synthetase TilS [Balneolaceae bacterium]|nr:tRNA lysidine(34) synthetase TilS [Balneolaceae bacterium]
MSRYELSPVVIKFQKEIEKFLPENPSVILGVSGGPDSMALLYLLNRAGIDTFVVHCNYGLRGDASDKDQKLVEDICKLWNFECLSVRLDYEDSEGENFQNWARERRYEVFFDMKKDQDADFVVTAHHQDDQIETIFQRILRGSGLSGWSGMKVIEDELFRPLLSVSKKEIMEFVQQFNIPYRIDSTNEESTYARNFLRNNWFPELNNTFPGWRKNILEVSARANEFRHLVDLAAENIILTDGKIHRKRFLSKPEPVQRVIFHHAIEKYYKNSQISGDFLKNIGKLSQLQTGAKLSVSANLEVLRDRDYFVFITPNVQKSGNRIIISEDEITTGLTYMFFNLYQENFSNLFEPTELKIDIDSIIFPITVRDWKSGDKIRPLGMKGSQLISDHLTNRKVSTASKNNVKVIESFDGTICAVIFPPNSGVEQIGTISEASRCTEATSKSLTISYK